MTEWAVPATVIRIVDGDTIVANLDLGWHIRLEQYIRFEGVNTPEMNTDEGKSAKEYIQSLIKPGDKVSIVSKEILGATGKYGRVLATVHTEDGCDLVQLLLKTGHGVPTDY